MLFGDEPRFYKDLKPLYEGGGLFAHGEVSHVASRFVARVRADNLYLFFTECKNPMLLINCMASSLNSTHTHHTNTTNCSILRQMRLALTLVPVLITLNNWRMTGNHHRSHQCNHGIGLYPNLNLPKILLNDQLHYSAYLYICHDSE